MSRTRALTGVQAINQKRFHRVMKASSLLLPKAPQRPFSSRLHDGVVSVAESNQRWCSDGFEIFCNNGEVVTGVFMKDCCDCDARAPNFPLHQFGNLSGTAVIS